MKGRSQIANLTFAKDPFTEPRPMARLLGELITVNVKVIDGGHHNTVMVSILLICSALMLHKKRHCQEEAVGENNLQSGGLTVGLKKIGYFYRCLK